MISDVTFRILPPDWPERSAYSVRLWSSVTVLLRFASKVGHCGPAKTGVFVTVAYPAAVSTLSTWLEYHAESGCPGVYRRVRSGLISARFGIATLPRLTS